MDIEQARHRELSHDFHYTTPSFPITVSAVRDGVGGAPSELGRLMA